MSAESFAAAARRLLDQERALFAGVAGVGVLKLVSSALAVAITIVLARLLGPAEFGSYSFAFSLATLLALPLLQGLPTLAVREAGRAGGHDRAAVSHALLHYANRLTIGVGIALAALAGTAAGLGRTLGTPLLTAMALAMPLLMVATLVRGSVVRAFGRHVAGQVPDMLVRPLAFLALLVLAWTWPLRDAGVAMTLHASAAVVAFGVAAWQVRRCGVDALAAAATSAPTRDWTRALLPLSTVAGLQLFNSQVDLVLLGMLGARSEVGVYRVAAMLALQTSFVLTVVNAVAAPKFAALYREGRLAELLRLKRLGATLSIAFGAALFVLFALAGRPLIRLAVGAQYEGAYVPLLVLAGAHVGTLWAGTTNVLLNMIGRERDVLVCAGISAGLNALLCALAIPRWGMLGAAVGSALALLAWRILLSQFLRRRLDVAPA